MKRLGRWLFNLAAAASLVVWVGAAALWARSYFIADLLITKAWPEDQQGTRDGFYSVKGAFVVYQLRPTTERGSMTVAPGIVWAHPPASPMKAQPSFPPISMRWDPPNTPLRWHVRLSDWLVFFLAGCLPAMWAWRRSRMVRCRRRIEQGRCTICGYDLRATPQRCPECGAIPIQLNGATS